MFSRTELVNKLRRLFYGFIGIFAKPLGLLILVIGKYVPTESMISYLKSLPDFKKIDIRNELSVKGKLDYEPVDIFLHIESNYENHTRTRSATKEPDTVKWLEEYILPGDIFYDIGANVGAYSMIASKIRKGDVLVYAFEPSFPTFVQLCKNVILNECQDSIIPLQIALSDETGIVNFNYYSLEPGRALNSLGDACFSDGRPFKPVYSQHVVSYKIDDLISQFGLPIPNHMKIDVDGSEISVLNGASHTISHGDLKSLMIEVDETEELKLTRVKEFLYKSDFAVHEKYHCGGQINYFLFVR